MDRLNLARELEAIAQTGLHFSQDIYDRERYERLRKIATELLAEASDLSTEEIYAWSREQFGYATPKVDVRAFVVSEGKVLLLREDADEGRWTLPGGWADVNEPPSLAVARETEEESGYQVKVVRLLAVLDRELQGHQPPHPYHVYKMFFLCEIIGGEARQTMESSESGFFAPDDLPELSLGRVLPEQIQTLYQRVEAGNMETLFD